MTAPGAPRVVSQVLTRGPPAAQAQRELVELVTALTEHGADVSNGIHSVAGRMPGQMSSRSTFAVDQGHSSTMRQASRHTRAPIRSPI